VTVIQAHQLAAINLRGLCGAYVKVRLLPAKHPTFTTHVQHCDCDPFFNETFTFEVILKYRPMFQLTIAQYFIDYRLNQKNMAICN